MVMAVSPLVLSPDHPSLRAAYEFHEIAHLGVEAEVLLDLRERALEAQLGAREHAIGPLQGLDRLRLEALPLEADGVDTVRLRRPAADGLYERQDVLGTDRVAADEGVL